VNIGVSRFYPFTGGAELILALTSMHTVDL
jgi:hypothetical protein